MRLAMTKEKHLFFKQVDISHQCFSPLLKVMLVSSNCLAKLCEVHVLKGRSEGHQCIHNLDLLVWCLEDKIANKSAKLVVWW